MINEVPSQTVEQRGRFCSNSPTAFSKGDEAQRMELGSTGTARPEQEVQPSSLPAHLWGIPWHVLTGSPDLLRTWDSAQYSMSAAWIN